MSANHCVVEGGCLSLWAWNISLLATIGAPKVQFCFPFDIIGEEYNLTEHEYPEIPKISQMLH